MSSVIVGVYLVVLGLLAIFGAHRLHLTLTWLLARRTSPPAGPLAPPPVVTVQLPLYNERWVAERLIRAACALRHPRGALEIQVLDDSTDDTSDIVARLVAEMRDAGVDIHHLRRPERAGYKAGALGWGMGLARGELFAIFDADFLPSPDFLERTIPWFVAPDVGMVQARWEHLNRDFSPLTRIQAVLLDGHFVVEHGARHLAGRFFNFNGTAGVWRRQAIVDGGGWQADTLTEDLDLSYRSQLQGWRFVFLPDVVVPAELPVDASGFKAQQYRWSKGSIQCARKLLPTIWRSRLPLDVRMEASAHLLNNIAWPLVFLLVVLMPAVVAARTAPGLGPTLGAEGAVLLLSLGSVLLFYGASQRALGERWLGRIPWIPLTLSVGAALAVNNTAAVVDALLRRPSPFKRTAKYAVHGATDPWMDRGYEPDPDPTARLELALGIWLGLGALTAASLGRLGGAAMLGLLAGGSLFLGGLSLAQRRQRCARAHS